MRYDLQQVCDVHRDRFDCPDALVAVEKNGTYALIVHDGGRSTITIAYCPWCGTKLPTAEDVQP